MHLSTHSSPPSPAPPFLAIAASPCESQVNIPPTPTPATAFEPSRPIQAMSVMLYKVPRNDDAMIGTASFVSVFRIGPFVKFPSIFIPHPFLFFIIHKSYYTWFNIDFHQELSIYIKNPFEEILFSKRAFCLNLFIIFLRRIQ